MTIPSLQKPVQLLLFFFGAFAGLYFAKPFLVPFVIAALLAMLLLPLCAGLERRRWPRALAVIVCLLCVVAVIAGVLSLLAWQLADLAKDASSIERNIDIKLYELRRYVDDTFGISGQQQDEMMNSGGGSQGRLQGLITGFLAGLGSFLTNTVLMFVYLFLLLYYRSHLKKAVLMLVPQAEKANAEKTISESRLVAQKYITGMAIMIACLWVLYGIGFSIVGVKSAIFFAILCGLLEIVPFVGNLAGTAFTMIMVFAQGGSGGMMLGVLVVYAVVQAVQTYILEPLIVGAEVSINPLTTIAGIVVGELVWGIPGMVLAIPVIGIIKIICDHVEAWKPVGFLLGEVKEKSHQR